MPSCPVPGSTPWIIKFNLMFLFDVATLNNIIGPQFLSFVLFVMFHRLFDHAIEIVYRTAIKVWKTRLPSCIISYTNSVRLVKERKSQGVNHLSIHCLILHLFGHILKVNILSHVLDPAHRLPFHLSFRCIVYPRSDFGPIIYVLCEICDQEWPISCSKVPFLVNISTIDLLLKIPCSI